ncbi:MAG: carboxylate--amine ligase [Solirubrobacteraceae bacterium]
MPDGATEEQIMECLDEASRALGRAILVPIDDAASVFVDDHVAELRDGFIFPLQPPGLARRLSSKRGMYELCVEHGIPTPVSAFPESEEEVRLHAADASFPVVAKCINAGEAPPGAPRVVIADDVDALLNAYREMATATGHNVMLQEYVPGTPESVWMFNGYFDSTSVCRLGFTGKKIRQSPPYTGATTLGVCLANATVYDNTVKLMSAIGYRGILDLGYRHDARDDQYKLIDVNPRIGGTFRLFVGEDGVDVLRAMYLDLTGESVSQSAALEGRRWIVEPLDIGSTMTYIRRGDITPRDWLRSLSGVRECAWFAADDPLPFLALWPALLRDRMVPRRSG